MKKQHQTKKGLNEKSLMSYRHIFRMTVNKRYSFLIPVAIISHKASLKNLNAKRKYPHSIYVQFRVLFGLQWENEKGREKNPTSPVKKIENKRIG